MPVSLESLQQLAREPSSERRREFVRAAATALFTAPDRTPAELDPFDEIMDMVLDEIEPLGRRELAERIAELDRAPLRTLTRLAGDAIDVAEPVLIRSPALGDDILVPIARKQSQDHLLAIAQRKSLSEMVTDILVERGDDRVAGTVTANDGARFSRLGFAALARRAAACEAILNRLVMRRDLPPEIAEELRPVLAVAIAAKINAAHAGPDNVRRSDETWFRVGARCGGTNRARPLTVLKDEVERGHMTVGEAVAELADADHAVELAAFLGLRLGLRSDTIVRNMFAADEDTLMLLCRGAALELDAFSAILRMRRRRRRGSVAEPVRLMKDYLRIPRADAANAMRSVREQERVA